MRKLYHKLIKETFIRLKGLLDFVWLHFSTNIKRILQITKLQKTPFCQFHTLSFLRNFQSNFVLELKHKIPFQITTKSEISFSILSKERTKLMKNTFSGPEKLNPRKLACLGYIWPIIDKTHFSGAIFNSNTHGSNVDLYSGHIQTVSAGV